MTSPTSVVRTFDATQESYVQTQVNLAVDCLINSLPDPASLTALQRRGIIARYAAVLEGNFIYWMTGAYLSAKSEKARTIIMENLHEEVRDCHPGMLRKFTLAANALPRESDTMAVHQELANVRLFIGKLSPVPLILMMAFFEGFIQRFMPFLAELAAAQGSLEQEYTDVHGVCDVVHTQELFRALEAEISLNPPAPGAKLFEGVELLAGLIQSIVPGVRFPELA
ncbi:MAG TPA: hypothetical protein VMH80_05245 [Bryobacteraceae bacterium]|nr:hypothetical protein [Bryobacteraceae bacterium]